MVNLQIVLVLIVKRNKRTIKETRCECETRVGFYFNLVSVHDQLNDRLCCYSFSFSVLKELGQWNTIEGRCPTSGPQAQNYDDRCGPMKRLGFTKTRPLYRADDRHHTDRWLREWSINEPSDSKHPTWIPPSEHYPDRQVGQLFNNRLVGEENLVQFSSACNDWIFQSRNGVQRASSLPVMTIGKGLEEFQFKQGYRAQFNNAKVSLSPTLQIESRSAIRQL